MVPGIIPDPVREEVTNLYCPGNTSPLPHIARQTFRPRSAPPLVCNRRFKSPSPTENIPTEILSLLDSRANKTVAEITDYKPGSSGKDGSDLHRYEMRDSFCMPKSKKRDYTSSRRPSTSSETTRRTSVKFAENNSYRKGSGVTSRESVVSRSSDRAEPRKGKSVRSSITTQSIVAI